jgi:hypothetical protein
LILAVDVMFPVGYTTVNSEAPEDQPWLQSAYPQGFQEYFDTVRNDIVTLKSAPMSKTHIMDMIVSSMANTKKARSSTGKENTVHAQHMKDLKEVVPRT